MFRSSVSLLCAVTLLAASRPSAPPPPATPVESVADTLHGTVVPDPYRWLENGTDPRVLAWVDQQNAYTRAALDPWPGRPALTALYERLYAIPLVSQVQVAADRVFLTTRSGLAGQPVVEMHDGRGGPGRVVLDPNALSARGLVSIDWKYVSPGGKYIAYGRSEGGSEQSELLVRDVDAGKDLADRIPRTRGCTLAWDPDVRGFVYTRHPAKGDVPAGEEPYHIRVYHHALGTDWREDALVFGDEGRPLAEERRVTLSSDGRWVLLTTMTDRDRNDVYLRPAGARGAFVPLSQGVDAEVGMDVDGSTLYVVTTLGAPRYRLMRATLSAQGKAGSWQDLIPQQTGVIAGFLPIKGRLVLLVNEKATSRLELRRRDGSLERTVTLPTLGTVAEVNGDLRRDEFYFRFSSYTYPAMIFRCDARTGVIEPVVKRDLPFDPSAYETTQEWARSKDGTRVPMFVTRKRGLEFDGARPTILTGYGGFNRPEMPDFRTAILPWLDAGGVFADAVLRGGSEFGREWHDAGRLEKRQNVYDDFYACAEQLIADRVTNPSKLACRGASNGGLLVAVAITQRPELWGAAVAEVPVIDMLRYQRFLLARFWASEYGSVDDSTQFRALLAYSPYHNVREGIRYPPVLFTAGTEDSRVDPLHARKMTARLQATQGGGPFLLRVEQNSGHGPGAPTRKRIEAAVDTYGFLMDRLGVKVEDAHVAGE